MQLANHNPVERTIGMELEISLIGERTARDVIAREPVLGRWKVKSDGSIPEGGAEIVSAPSTKEKIHFHMKKMFPKILENGGRAMWASREFEQAFNAKSSNRNFRCTGLHVHVDAKELNDWQKAAIVLIYQKLYASVKRNFPTILPQTELDMEIPVWDSEAQEFVNTKAKGLVDIRDKCEWAKVIANLEGRRMKEVSDFCKDAGSRARYWMVNPNALQRFGTLEFRQGMHTWNHDEIRIWMEYIHDIFKFVEVLPKAFKTEKDFKDALADEITGMARMHFYPWIERAMEKKAAIIMDYSKAINRNGGRLPESDRCAEWFQNIPLFSLDIHKKNQEDELLKKKNIYIERKDETPENSMFTEYNIDPVVYAFRREILVGSQPAAMAEERYDIPSAAIATLNRNRF